MKTFTDYELADRLIDAGLTEYDFSEDLLADWDEFCKIALNYGFVFSTDTKTWHKV